MEYVNVNISIDLWTSKTSQWNDSTYDTTQSNCCTISTLKMFHSIPSYFNKISKTFFCRTNFSVKVVLFPIALFIPAHLRFALFCFA